MGWIARHRGFALASLTTLCTLGLIYVAYRLVGHAAITAVYEQRAGWFNGLIDQPPARPLRGYWIRWDSAVRMLVIVVLALWAYGAGHYGLRVARVRARWIAAWLCVWWIGVEQLVAPQLIRPLKLQGFYFVRDPDHRPKKAGLPGWNEDSLRCAWAPGDFLETGTNIVFLGDSFTFGHPLPAEQSFPNKVEARLRERFPERDVKIANFGWVSSSPLLSYRRLADIGAKYHPDWVVMCVDMTDFRDEIQWQLMLDKRGIYWFYDEIPITLSLLKAYLPGAFETLHRWSTRGMPKQRYFVVQAPLEETRGQLQPLVQSLARIDDWCKERGARLVVVVLPRSFQYSDREAPGSWESSQYEVLGPFALEPFRFFEDLAKEVDYPIHSLLPAFRQTKVFPTCFESDPHWNDAGTTVAAEDIAALLEREIAAL